MHLAFDAQWFLDVMTKFVRDNVSLRELAWRSEPAIELIEKTEVNVNLFVLRAVERSGG
jgi:hypothetical protein